MVPYHVLLVDFGNRDGECISTRMGKEVWGLAGSTHELEELLPDARESIEADVIVYGRTAGSAITYVEVPHLRSFKRGKFAWASLQGIL
jgi:hypothetical protein